MSKSQQKRNRELAENNSRLLDALNIERSAHAVTEKQRIKAWHILGKICKAFPQTYGEMIVKYPWMKCQPHEWDNGCTWDNAVMLIEQSEAQRKIAEDKLAYIKG